MSNLNGAAMLTAFSKHTGNEFPPKYVFFISSDGVLNTVKTSTVKELPLTWDYMGQTHDIGSFKKTFERAGSIPVLKLKD